MLGWLAGIGCIILSIMHDNSFEYPPYGRPDPRIGILFGVALIIATSWIRKTRNEANDDIDEMNGVAVDNPPPKTELTQSMTLQIVKRKKLLQEGAYSPDKTSPRNGDPGDSA
jgi:hypothetical protein